MKRMMHTMIHLLVIAGFFLYGDFCNAMTTEVPLNSVVAPKVESEIGDRVVTYVRQQLKEPLLSLLASSEFTTKKVFKKRLEDVVSALDKCKKDMAADLANEVVPSLATSSVPASTGMPMSQVAATSTPTPTSPSTATPIPVKPAEATPVTLPMESAAPQSALPGDMGASMPTEAASGMGDAGMGMGSMPEATQASGMPLA